MHTPHLDIDDLIGEHRTLLRHYGKTQARCSELAHTQALEIEALQAQVMRLRAAVIVRDSALAWAEQDRAEREAEQPGLHRRRVLARHVEALMARVHELMRERLRSPLLGTAAPASDGVVPLQARASAGATLPIPEAPSARPDRTAEVLARPGLLQDDELGGLEARLTAADLVICQTGCLSHGAYWRVQDHCRRTGKPCVLVEQADALRIVHITPDTAESADTRVPHQGRLILPPEHSL